MLDLMEGAIVNAQGGKVNGEAIDIFVEMVVWVKVEAEELIGGGWGHESGDQAGNGRK